MDAPVAGQPAEARRQPRKILTIGGVDPCGAFGIGADLRAIATLGGFGMSVITVVTAQNSLGWYAAENMPAALVAGQLEAVLSDYGADAIKSGFIGRVDLIQEIASRLGAYPHGPFVVDPVLVDGRGRPMFPAEVTAAVIDHLLPLATLITPNSREGQLLLGLAPDADPDLETALPAFQELLASRAPEAWVLWKGVSHAGRRGDWLVNRTSTEHLVLEAVDTPHSSGSGDTLAAVAACFLADETTLRDAVLGAQVFTRAALERGSRWQLARGRGPVGVVGLDISRAG